MLNLKRPSHWITMYHVIPAYMTSRNQHRFNSLISENMFILCNSNHFICTFSLSRSITNREHFCCGSPEHSDAEANEQNSIRSNRIDWIMHESNDVIRNVHYEILIFANDEFNEFRIISSLRPTRTSINQVLSDIIVFAAKMRENAVDIHSNTRKWSRFETRPNKRHEQDSIIIS